MLRSMASLLLVVTVFAQACGGSQADPRTDALNDATAQDILHDLPLTDGFADSPDPGDLIGDAPGDIDATSDVAPPGRARKLSRGASVPLR